MKLYYDCANGDKTLKAVIDGEGVSIIIFDQKKSLLDRLFNFKSEITLPHTVSKDLGKALIRLGEIYGQLNRK